MTYILILTLIAGGYREAAPAVTAVNGFASQEACLVAGNAWLQQVRGQYQVEWARAACVRSR